MNKSCCTCKKVMSTNNFGRHKRTRDGFRENCKTCHAKYTKAWRLKNKHKYVIQQKEGNANRWARLTRATPLWSETKDILLMYDKAHMVGKVIDHIYPIKGKTVSGLHVLANLQMLTKEENLTKGTHVPGDVQ